MGKFKALSLDHRGFKCSGTVMVRMSDGEIGRAHMNSFFIPSDKLTHTAIKLSINDGKVGAVQILLATVYIYDVYGLNYTKFNRRLLLNEEQCLEAFKTTKHV